MSRFLVIPLLILLAACNPVANLGSGDEKVERFHQLYNKSDVESMWQFIGPKFKEVTTRQQLADLVEVLQARLGPVKSSERVNFNVNSSPGGTTTVIQMNTQYELGEGSEVFTFLGNGEDMQLVGWNVNSPRLMITPDDLKNSSPLDEESEAAPGEPATIAD